ncbi:MAG: F0F1 ATP synthase subunit gamma [Dysgonamonadaceae bacterium]|jgi:F-type H+-transporting ATPase subunit gamma|nr:F0F1 ATP synthase subunit gamma [Dysgonamonadaceae bacterium]
MASLKEIKGRIASVKSTQKITSAMKMVASAKLRKAQYQIENFLPYETRLMEILNSFLSSETDFQSVLSEKREVKRIAIVVLSSNSSLCGAFNSNMNRLLTDLLNRYPDLEETDVTIYPVGKKIEETVLKMDSRFQIQGSYIPLMDKPNFEGAREIADRLIADFISGKIDRVELIYNHFKTTAVQVPTVECFLPIELEKTQKQVASPVWVDYIVEPDKKTILESLIPKSLRTKIYAVLLDSAAAEQAARMVAMQIATDNAQEILEDLTIQFNKQRQQTITSELLDIIGGSEALK